MRTLIALAVFIALGVPTVATDPPPALQVQWAVSTHTFVFPNTWVGETASAVITVTNIGTTTAKANIWGGAPSGNSYSGHGNCTFDIPPGNSCRLTYTFTPTAIGVFESLVNLTIAGATSSVELIGVGLMPFAASPTSIAFGDVAPGVRSHHDMTITNLSTTSRDMGTTTAALLDPVDFTATSHCAGVTLLPHTSCAITLAFLPSSTLSYSTKATVAFSGLPSLSISLSGRGHAPAATSPDHQGNSSGSSGSITRRTPATGSASASPAPSPSSVAGVPSDAASDPSDRTATEPSMSPVASSSLAPSDSDAGLWVAIGVLGGVIATALLGGGAWLLVRRRKLTGGPPAAG